MDNSTRVIRPVHTIVDSTGFFRSAGQLLDWDDASGEIFMDIGCGGGHSSTQLLKVFPNLLKVIAIDFIPKRIDDAKSNNPHEKIEYRVANILDWSSLEEWKGFLSKIVSFHCFNYLRDQRLAFGNVYRLLKPGGSAAICMQLNSPHFDVVQELSEHPKWKEFIMDVEKVVPESHVMKYTASHYQTILEEVGFEVILCQEIETYFTYASDEECKILTSATIPLDKVVPSNQRQEFMDYTFKISMEKNSHPKRLNGLPYLKQCTLSIVIKKPL